jgi:dihydrofolate reductase
VKGVTGQFLDVSIDVAIRTANEAASGGDVVVLGANVARQCVEAGLLDEIIVHVAPVLVGDGVRFFDRPGGDPVRREAALSGRTSTSSRAGTVPVALETVGALARWRPRA